MAVTVAAKKTVGFRSPYTGETFQDLTKEVVGRDGYMSGGATTDDGASITVQPVKIVQRGIVAESTAVVTTLPVPTATEPWFLLAAIPDDDPDTGLSVSVTADVSAALNATVIAYKSNGIWHNPLPATVSGAQRTNRPEAAKEDGAASRGTLAAGNLSTVEVAATEVTDVDGVRRTLASGTAPFDSASLSTVLPHETRDRQDYAVLRQREDFSGEVVYLMGGCVQSAPATLSETSLALAVSGSSRPHYFAKRGGTSTEQWYVWGEGTSLNAKIGPAGVTVAVTSLGGTKANVIVAGLRASDGHIVLLYTEGNNLSVATMNSATGALVDGPVVIDTQPNAITHCRGSLDKNEILHVVYQHDELGTGLDQEVYYATVALTSAAFGVAGVSPRIVNGAPSAKNDTGPVIGVSRDGAAHITWITGTGGTSNVFGELRYSKVVAGVTTFQKTYSNTTDVGKDLNPEDDVPVELYSNGGSTISDVRSVDLVVTPHDEVFAIVIAKDSGDVDTRRFLLFSDGFESRLGFGLVDVPIPSSTQLHDVALTVDEQGSLPFVYASGPGSPDVIVSGQLDTVFAPNGIVGQFGGSILSTLGGLVASILAGYPTTSELLLEFGHSGEAWALFESTGGVPTAVGYPPNAGQIAAGQGGIAEESFGGATPTPHPKDVYLSSWFVPGDATPVLPEAEVNLVNIRPRKLNYPILVGDNGDFVGFNVLVNAIKTANKCGGTIIVRGGEYRLSSTVQVRSGVHIIGEGMPRLNWIGPTAIDMNWLRITNRQFNGSAVPVGISGQVVTLPSVALAQSVCPGDLVVMATSGEHRAVRSINDKVVLDGVPPAGATFTPYATGVVLENLLLTGEQTSTALIESIRTSRLRITNVAIKASSVLTDSIAIQLEDNIGSLIENCDFSDYNADAVNAWAVSTFLGRQVRVTGCLFRGDKAKLRIGSDTQDPTISDCIDADGTSGVGSTYRISNVVPRTTNVHFANNLGIVVGDAGHEVFLHTDVGRVIRSRDNAIGFQDPNIIASSAIVDNIMKLTSVTNKEFNGASKDTVTDAVNERLLLTGGSISGALILLSTLDVIGFSSFNDIDVQGNTTLEGPVLSEIIPASAVVANNLGNAALPWNLFSKVITMFGDLLPNAADTVSMGAVNRMEQVRARLLRADNVAGTAADPLLTLLSHDVQAAPIIDPTSAKGLKGWLMNPTGYPETRGPYYFDNFSTPFVPGDPVSFWTSKTAITSQVGDHIEMIASGVDNVQDVEGRQILDGNNLPGFTVKFKMVGQTTSRMDKFGFIEATLDHFSVRRDTADPSNPNEWIVSEVISSGGDNIPLGVTDAVADTWMYLSLIMIDVNGTFLFRIGTTQDWKSTDSIVVSNPSLPQVVNGLWTFRSSVTTKTTFSRELDLGFVQLFSQKHI